MNRIKQVLVKKRLTARWLAAQIGKTEHMVYKYTTNANQPPPRTLKKIARALNVSMDDLYVDE